MTSTDAELLQVPLSALEHYAYCPRQAGLILLEDGFVDDANTVRGTLVHQRVHEPDEEHRGNVRILRALPVWNDQLGLTGVCDVVEIHGDEQIIPVEHKSGKHVPGGPAEIQLAGQALCLEEMFGLPVPTGAIYSSADRHRHVIDVDERLRCVVADLAGRIRDLLIGLVLPEAVADKRCRRCSLLESCMPRVLASRGVYATAAASLFHPAPETDTDD